jgi:hypothetical protein
MLNLQLVPVIRVRLWNNRHFPRGSSEPRQKKECGSANLVWKKRHMFLQDNSVGIYQTGTNDFDNLQTSSPVMVT